ncbi:MAG: TIGR04086 family membrane protein [Ruminococcus sp.]|nr:TIGR04086 family membrane protein [Ruminococcus sp.]
MHNFSLNKSFIKALIVGSVVSLCIIVVLLCIMSAVLLGVSMLPYEYLSYIMLIFDAIAVFIGSYVAARINKESGLFIGLLNGGIVFIAILISGFCVSPETLSIVTLLKAVIILVFSSLGGIKGVNTKEKIHIR